MKEIDEQLETVFIMTNAKYSYLSSSGVREMVYFGGDISGFVPDCIRAEVMARGKQSLKR